MISLSIFSKFEQCFIPLYSSRVFINMSVAMFLPVSSLRPWLSIFEVYGKFPHHASFYSDFLTYLSPSYQSTSSISERSPYQVLNFVCQYFCRLFHRWLLGFKISTVLSKPLWTSDQLRFAKPVIFSLWNEISSLWLFCIFFPCTWVFRWICPSKIYSFGSFFSITSFYIFCGFLNLYRSDLYFSFSDKLLGFFQCLMLFIRQLQNSVVGLPDLQSAPVPKQFRSLRYFLSFSCLSSFSGQHGARKRFHNPKSSSSPNLRTGQIVKNLQTLGNMPPHSVQLPVWAASSASFIICSIPNASVVLASFFFIWSSEYKEGFFFYQSVISLWASFYPVLWVLFCLWKDLLLMPHYALWPFSSHSPAAALIRVFLPRWSSPMNNRPFPSDQMHS